MVYLLFIHRQRTTYWKFKEINSTEHRRKGLCPLTPKEVGIFLSGLGYPSTTLIYIAAGEIYGGDYSMAELKKQFPNLIRKVTRFPWWHLQFNMHLRILIYQTNAWCPFKRWACFEDGTWRWTSFSGNRFCILWASKWQVYLELKEFSRSFYFELRFEFNPSQAKNENV